MLTWGYTLILMALFAMTGCKTTKDSTSSKEIPKPGFGDSGPIDGSAQMPQVSGDPSQLKVTCKITLSTTVPGCVGLDFEFVVTKRDSDVMELKKDYANSGPIRDPKPCVPDLTEAGKKGQLYVKYVEEDKRMGIEARQKPDDDPFALLGVEDFTWSVDAKGPPKRPGIYSVENGGPIPNVAQLACSTSEYPDTGL